MEKNRLQTALEEVKLRRPVIDLIDTNFHKNGFLYLEAPLRELVGDYFSSRMYDPDSRGAPGARRAIRDFYAGEGLVIGENDIVITASASESYDLLFSTLAEPGDEVLLPTPGYPLFEYLSAKARLEPSFYRLDPDAAWAIDLDSVESAVNGRTKFLVLISPNNPTGSVAGEAEIRELLALCSRHGIMLITDEVFSDFLYRDGPLPRPARDVSDVTVFTINGISKLFACPDLKLSWIAVTGPEKEEILGELEVANDVFLSCSSLSQHILPGLFRKGDAFRASMRRELASRRELLVSTLSGSPAVSFVPPAGGIHCVLGITGREGEDDEELAVELLRSRGVYVHPGYFYGIDGRTMFVVSFLRERGALGEGLVLLKEFAESGPA